MASQPKPPRLKALATYRVLATRARAVLGTTKLTTTAVNALARTAALAALGNGRMISVAVKASFLVTGAKTGKFFILRELADALTASEIRNFNMSKLRSEEIQAVDRALAHIGKVLADAARVADQVDRLVGKGVTDVTPTSETLVRDSTKALADVTPATDQAAKEFSTTRADAFVTGDATQVTAGKGIDDPVLTADILDRTVAFIRVFADTADATDEINANLLTDDGEVMFLEKVLLERINTNEQLAFDLARVQADTVTTGEDALLAMAKQLDDIVNVGDFDVFDLAKLLNDQVGAVDVAALGVGLSAQDTAVTSELATRDFRKSLFDTVTTSDSLQFFLEAYYADTAVTSEQVEVVRIAAGGVPAQIENQFMADLTLLGVNKNFFDSVGVTDDFYGEAVIDDDQITFLGKNLTENLLTAELRTVALQRTLQESASAGDSGLLAMTDYCDSTYFSQAYVGTERIFS